MAVQFAFPSGFQQYLKGCLGMLLSLMSELLVLGYLHAMPCPCSDLTTATNAGLVSVVRFMGARGLAGVLCSGLNPEWCYTSVVKAVAGSWSGWHQIGTFTFLKAKSCLPLSPSYLKERLVLVTLCNGYISPRESFWSHCWS